MGSPVSAVEVSEGIRRFAAEQVELDQAYRSGGVAAWIHEQRQRIKFIDPNDPASSGAVTGPPADVAGADGGQVVSNEAG